MNTTMNVCLLLALAALECIVGYAAAQPRTELQRQGTEPRRQDTEPQRQARDRAWRTAIRHQLYVPERLPALEATTRSTFSPVAGVVADRVTYRTADGMLVPAIVYRPDPAATRWTGRLPGIAIVNGHGGDKYSWYAFYSGMMFARAGAEVLTYDPIGEGERNAEGKSRASSHDRWVEPAAGLERTDWGQRLGGLMQVDAMQAVRYLQSRPEVNPARVALLGYSMGAFVAGITGAIWSPQDGPALHAVLLSGGGTYDDAADGGKAYDVGKLPCQAPVWLSLKILGEGFHRRGAILYALNADRGPMLVENGSDDEVMDIPHRTPEWFAALRAQAIALHGSDRTMFTTHVDAGKSHRTAWVERPGVAWLNQQLHFALWSAAGIASLPTTHISTWAAANHVDISQSSLAESREGGLDALGVGLPGVSRSDLTVLPAAERRQRAGELTYEAWAAKTLEAEAQAAVSP
ncbi:MAG: prolyl oligopeptidase family serine peptidase [Acidobacteriota bacterium]|nr:prolyl oligopeptidase family serine peptidase [Acidobacteriota bacterium]